MWCGEERRGEGEAGDVGGRGMEMEVEGERQGETSNQTLFFFFSYLFSSLPCFSFIWLYEHISPPLQLILTAVILH